KLKKNNSRKEYYLTDLVQVGLDHGRHATYVKCEEEECLGVNSQLELSLAEKQFQNDYRGSLLESGVSLISPETCFFSYDTEIKSGCIIEPYVVFGPGVRILNSTIIKSFCYIEGSHIGRNCQIGPFARLRPQSNLFDGVKIGNFVEVKNSMLSSSTKINHLSYLGDARVGKKTNVGAGTIFCNYDGKNKHRTIVGDNVFIGSNSSIIAPLEIGDEAVIAAGSTLTKDVPSRSLAIARTNQQNKVGLGKKIMIKLRTMADMINKQESK
ncbi:bifunctional UDP-N-acetylglucosamine diphosphorylase/glucosamine-1-phosphate N-acetyltransferase GlmU, partial [Paracoccaceae bacterium]|nr:bifunctional UDP-N-acetylglucosamine diphosphorylase/glucosamine-1-phosphate N-acetyltransferase GlmU [Paracoccaceae bacterium]